MPAFVRLLRDNEAEVRIASAGKVTKFCTIVNPELSIQHILPYVKVTALPSVFLYHSMCVLQYLDLHMTILGLTSTCLY